MQLAKELPERGCGAEPLPSYSTSSSLVEFRGELQISGYYLHGDF